MGFMGRSYAYAVHTLRLTLRGERLAVSFSQRDRPAGTRQRSCRTLFAIDDQLAAVELCKGLGQRQPQPGAIVLAGELAVDLPERLKGYGDVFPAHADAGIADAQLTAPVLTMVHGQFDASPCGRELDGVRQQVQKDLLQPDRVHDEIGLALDRGDDQLQPGRRYPFADKPTAAVEDVGEADLFLPKLKLTGFDFGDIEKISFIKLSRCCPLSWMSFA